MRLHSPPHALGLFCHQSRWQISREGGRGGGGGNYRSCILRKHRITLGQPTLSSEADPIGHKIDDEHDEDDLNA